MATKTREGLLVEAFVTLADTLVVGYDLVDLLHTLVSQCVPLFQASAAGIILTDDEEFEVVASTNERSRLVEILQLRSGSGPCVESVVTGRAVSVPDIARSGPTWPRFRDGALEQGFASMFSVPMRLRTTTIGSLNLFWDRTGGLPPEDAPTVQALADVATIGILQERALRESDVARQQHRAGQGGCRIHPSGEHGRRVQPDPGPRQVQRLAAGGRGRGDRQRGPRALGSTDL
jgi:transcriptional regulator with GAF, ATPase, and Fis domain